MKSALYGKCLSKTGSLKVLYNILSPVDTEEQSHGEGTWAEVPWMGCHSSGDGHLLWGCLPQMESSQADCVIGVIGQV